MRQAVAAVLRWKEVVMAHRREKSFLSVFLEEGRKLGWWRSEEAATHLQGEIRVGSWRIRLGFDGEGMRSGQARLAEPRWIWFLGLVVQRSGAPSWHGRSMPRSGMPSGMPRSSVPSGMPRSSMPWADLLDGFFVFGFNFPCILGACIVILYLLLPTCIREGNLGVVMLDMA